MESRCQPQQFLLSTAIRPKPVLRAEITVSKMRIRQLLVRQGYTVGTRHVARLMKEMNLLVAVKRLDQPARNP